MLETSGPLHPLQGDVRPERDLAGHPGDPGMYCVVSGMVLVIGGLAGAHHGGRSLRGVVALRGGLRRQRPEPRATAAKAMPPGFDVASPWRALLTPSSVNFVKDYRPIAKRDRQSANTAPFRRGRRAVSVR